METQQNEIEQRCDKAASLAAQGEFANALAEVQAILDMPDQSRLDVRFCLTAAAWAQRSDNTEVTRCLALSALKECEQSAAEGRKDEGRRFEWMADCIALLAPFTSDAEGATLIESHPNLFKAAFGHWLTYPYYLSDLWQVKDASCELVPVAAREDQVPLVLTRWCLARARPHWALALADLALRHTNSLASHRAQALEALRSQAEEAVLQLRRQVECLSGPVKLAKSLAYDHAWLAWPTGGNSMLYAEIASGAGRRRAAPRLGEWRPLETFAIDSREALPTFLDNCSRRTSDQKVVWGYRDLEMEARFGFHRGRNWWSWERGAKLLSLLASPIAWFMVWLLPLCALLLGMGFGELVGLPAKVPAFLQPAAWGLFALVWLFSLWHCRVVRLLRIEASEGRVAWIAVPVPIHQLLQLEIDSINYANAQDYATQYMRDLDVQKVGDFVSIGSRYYRLSSIRSWVLKPQSAGWRELGAYSVFAVGGPLFAIGAQHLIEYLFKGMPQLLAIPVFTVLYGIVALGWLLGIGGVGILVQYFMGGKFRAMNYQIGYSDMGGEFVAVTDLASSKVCSEVFVQLQKKVAEVTQ